MAELLDINFYTAKEQVNTLKEKGVLEREGGTRGYWKVVFTKRK